MAKRKLTNRDLAEIFYMILEGFTIKEASEKYGILESTISYRLSRAGVRFELRCMNSIPNYYPNIRAWMIQNRVSEGNFAAMLGVCQATVSALLNGKNVPSKRIVDSVLKTTGLTYEQAFATEQTEDEEES